jgi:uncharacterized protein (UPF0262 family)
MSANHLVDVILDEGSLAAASADVEHERRIAVFDLKESNVFGVDGLDEGPYTLSISLNDGRLVLDAARASDHCSVRVLILSLTPFRRIIKDYFFVCDSYYQAIRNATAAQIEAIDMGRRGLHNEGSELLVQRLAGKFSVDFDTARRLFTLICALHIRA